MTFLTGSELFIIALTAAALVLGLFFRTRRASAAFALAAACLSLLMLKNTMDDPRFEMLPVYLIAFLYALSAGIRILWKRKRPESLPAKKEGFRKFFRLAIPAFALYLLAVPLMITPMISDGYQRDLTRHGQAEAFHVMHEELSREYPFTRWKDIDWDELKQSIQPLIEDAGTESDPDGFVLALRRYVHRIPDGHVRFSAPDEALRQKAVGGGYGMNIAETANGEIIVTEVFKNSPADRAGLRFGTVVETFEGKPVLKALEATEIIWASRPPATKQNRRLEELRFLVRGPAGTRIRMTGRLPGKELPEIFELTAEKDGGLTLSASDPYAFASLDKGPLETALIDERYGYIHLKVQRFPDRSTAQMERAVQGFTAAGVEGIIVDLRGNRGGSDFAVPLLVRPFFDKKDLYHHPSLYDPLTGHFREIPFNAWDPFIPVISYRVRPGRPPYQGPLAVLIDQSTASSAEGIALLLSRLPNAELIGFYGTSGILGSGNVKSWVLPGNIQVQMLSGRSLDASGEIQVDADDVGVGGVSPTIRIPKTMENLRAVFIEKRDLPLEKAMEWIHEKSGGETGKAGHFP